MARPTQRPALSCTKAASTYTRSNSDIKEQQHSSSWFKFLHLDLELYSSSNSPKLHHPESSSPLSALLISCMGFNASQQRGPPSPPGGSANSVSPSPRSRNISFFKWLALCLVGFIVLAAILTLGSRHRVYTGYRRLEEGTLQALSSQGSSLDLGNPSLKNVKGCPDGMENHVPCYGSSKAAGQEFDRHCDSLKEKHCIIKPPKGYKLPMKWPASNKNLWSENVKVAGEHPSRMLIEDNIIRLPSEESLMQDYVLELERMISGGNSSFTELGIRVVLDVGSRLAAFASALLTKNILTMSVSPYEQTGGAVQFAQERGLPAMIAWFSSLQLPFPFSSYDLIHCSSCGVQWQQKGGIFLLEVNRLLRPGGYFIWTPSLNESSDNILRTMGKQTTGICWSQVAHNDRTIIWQKTTKQRCYSSRRITVALCGPEAGIQPKLKACLTEAPKGRWRTVQQQHKWPNRLMLSARRLSRYGMSPENFSEDVQFWLGKLANYWSLMTPVIFSDHPKRPGDDDPAAPTNVVRNIMDMNAQYGAFNAALLSSNKPVWVMNVVPSSAPNTLTAVYDRGLLGARHDWCEAFPAYPRSYDLLYAASLLSQELGRTKPCGLPKLVLEMDRLLRPEGWILLQDERQVIETARSLLVQIRWEARIIEIPGESDQRLLVGQKNWRK